MRIIEGGCNDDSHQAAILSRDKFAPGAQHRALWRSASDDDGNIPEQPVDVGFGQTELRSDCPESRASGALGHHQPFAPGLNLRVARLALGHAVAFVERLRPAGTSRLCAPVRGMLQEDP